MNTDEKRDQLVAAVNEWAQTHARWEAEAIACAAEGEGIRSRMGQTVLADEAQAAVLSTRLRELSDRRDIARQTAAAAAPHLTAARSEVLEHDACGFDTEAEVLEQILRTHRAKTAKLLAQLERHEGVFVHERRAAIGMDGLLDVKGDLPQSHELEQRVFQARTKAGVLRDLAEGHDPTAQVYLHDPGPDGRLTRLADVHGLVHGLPQSDYFTASVWGPGAVVPAPAYEREVDNLRSHLAQHDSDVGNFDAMIGEKRERLAALQAELDAQPPSRGGQVTYEVEELRSKTASLGTWIRELEAEHASAPQRRVEIVAELEALTGDREHATA
ncbi:hypothetical protein [Aeromicrobium sp.]|uniref:hypothetical protein n=1 Tax=Aeromicrobium sp. TaxID=1871063 RepID=UPI0030C5B8E7